MVEEVEIRAPVMHGVGAAKIPCPDDDTAPESIDERIDSLFQASWQPLEEIGLLALVPPTQIVCRHTDQSEGSGMIESVEQLAGEAIECLARVVGARQLALASQQVERRGLESHANPTGDIVLVPEPTSNSIGRIS